MPNFVSIKLLQFIHKNKCSYFRLPVSYLRVNQSSGLASRGHKRQDNGLPWKLPPAPPAAVTWRSSWSNNHMNLVICHYRASTLNLSFHEKSKENSSNMYLAFIKKC